MRNLYSSIQLLFNSKIYPCKWSTIWRKTKSNFEKSRSFGTLGLQEFESLSGQLDKLKHKDNNIFQTICGEVNSCIT